MNSTNFRIKLTFLFLLLLKVRLFLFHCFTHIYIPDYRFKNNLHFVKIYFGSSAFDVITKVNFH